VVVEFKNTYLIPLRIQARSAPRVNTHGVLLVQTSSNRTKTIDGSKTLSDLKKEEHTPYSGGALKKVCENPIAFMTELLATTKFNTSDGNKDVPMSFDFEGWARAEGQMDQLEANNFIYAMAYYQLCTYKLVGSNAFTKGNAIAHSLWNNRTNAGAMPSEKSLSAALLKDLGADLIVGKGDKPSLVSAAAALLGDIANVSLMEGAEMDNVIDKALDNLSKEIGSKTKDATLNTLGKCKNNPSLSHPLYLHQLITRALTSRPSLHKYKHTHTHTHTHKQKHTASVDTLLRLIAKRLRLIITDPFTEADKGKVNIKFLERAIHLAMVKDFLTNLAEFGLDRKLDEEVINAIEDDTIIDKEVKDLVVKKTTKWDGMTMQAKNRIVHKFMAVINSCNFVTSKKKHGEDKYDLYHAMRDMRAHIVTQRNFDGTITYTEVFYLLMYSNLFRTTHRKDENGTYGGWGPNYGGGFVTNRPVGTTGKSRNGLMKIDETSNQRRQIIGLDDFIPATRVLEEEGGDRTTFVSAVDMLRSVHSPGSTGVEPGCWLRIINLPHTSTDAVSNGGDDNENGDVTETAAEGLENEGAKKRKAATDNDAKKRARGGRKKDEEDNEEENEEENEDDAKVRNDVEWSQIVGTRKKVMGYMMERNKKAIEKLWRDRGSLNEFWSTLGNMFDGVIDETLVSLIHEDEYDIANNQDQEYEFDDGMTSSMIGDETMRDGTGVLDDGGSVEDYDYNYDEIFEEKWDDRNMELVEKAATCLDVAIKKGYKEVKGGRRTFPKECDEILTAMGKNDIGSSSVDDNEIKNFASAAKMTVCIFYYDEKKVLWPKTILPTMETTPVCKKDTKEKGSYRTIYLIRHIDWNLHESPASIVGYSVLRYNASS
jgi:hypothetical protein